MFLADSFSHEHERNVPKENTSTEDNISLQMDFNVYSSMALNPTHSPTQIAYSCRDLATVQVTSSFL